jgi:arylsulfatase A-like enzyme
MANKQLIFLDIDGILPEVLHETLDDPKSNLSRIAGRGLRAERGVTVFPSVTLSCQASMFTGVYPGEHGIVGNLWFDRHVDPPVYRKYTDAKTAAGVYGFGLFGWPTIILPERPELMYANNDLSRDVKTVYEMANEKGLSSWQVFNQFSRGVGRWTRPSRPEMCLFALCHEELVHNSRWDRATFRHLFKDMRKAPLPDILVFYISGHDSNSHENGPDNQREYFRSVVDPLFGNFITEFEKHRPIEEFIFVITADHCQAKTIRDKNYIITNDIQAEILTHVAGGGFKLFDRKQVRDGDTAVICTEAGTAQVHLMNRVTGKWADQPRFEEDLIPAAETFEKYKTGDKAFVDLILLRREFGADYEVYENGKLIGIEEYFSGKETDYPDAVNRIRGVNCSRSGDLTVLIDYSKGYYFGDKVKAGEHGNLHAADSLIPFVISGPGIPDKTIPYARLVDAVPTVGKLMGFETPGVAGKSLL